MEFTGVPVQAALRFSRHPEQQQGRIGVFEKIHNGAVHQLRFDLLHQCFLGLVPNNSYQRNF